MLVQFSLLFFIRPKSFRSPVKVGRYSSFCCDYPLVMRFLDVVCRQITICRVNLISRVRNRPIVIAEAAVSRLAQVPYLALRNVVIFRFGFSSLVPENATVVITSERNVRKIAFFTITFVFIISLLLGMCEFSMLNSNVSLRCIVE